MRSKLLSISLSLLISTFAISTAQAASKGIRPCTASDLIGTWDMKSMNSKVKLDPSQGFGWPYQRFTFNAKAGVKEIAASAPLENNKEALRKFENELTTSLYNVDQKGVLTITKLESPAPERCLCTYALSDVPAELLAKMPAAKRAAAPQKGDVALTYLDRQGRPVLIKGLKKVG